jgi:HAD superfamily hydrolase (TIGR01458 family)
LDVRGFLIDLDGVLYVGKNPVPGARELLALLEEKGYPYRFVSNSTRRRRRSVADRLQGLGYQIPESYIFTPPLSAVERIKNERKTRCYLLTTGDVHLDFQDAGLEITSKDADYVVVGDAGKDFTFDRLNQALRLILDGAGLLALEKDRYWQESEGLVLSTGPFVAALEYATGIKAELMGKPAREFFQMALKDMGLQAEDVAMIGDDIFTDVAGSQALGIKGILVKTGKYREEIAASAGIIPDLILESIADLEPHL